MPLRVSVKSTGGSLYGRNNKNIGQMISCTWRRTTVLDAKVELNLLANGRKGIFPSWLQTGNEVVPAAKEEVCWYVAMCADCSSWLCLKSLSFPYTVHYFWPGPTRYGTISRLKVRTQQFTWQDWNQTLHCFMCILHECIQVHQLGAKKKMTSVWVRDLTGVSKWPYTSPKCAQFLSHFDALF